MDTIVQWTTIFSPIIAVLLAIWMVWSSNRDTAKQIDSIKESTSRQIERIKDLSRQMIEASIKQVELEIEKTLLLARQAQQEWEGVKEINKSEMNLYEYWHKGQMRDYQEQKPQRDYQLYSSFVKKLEVIKKNLEANKKGLNA
ncbi:MAG: hypothetical protein IKU03_02670 [Bacteroidales bacterium]|nr:hypothetical protein [Bacteroidales bacterium]